MPSTVHPLWAGAYSQRQPVNPPAFSFLLDFGRLRRSSPEPGGFGFSTRSFPVFGVRPTSHSSLRVVTLATTLSMASAPREGNVSALRGRIVLSVEAAPSRLNANTGALLLLSVGICAFHSTPWMAVLLCSCLCRVPLTRPAVRSQGR